MKKFTCRTFLPSAALLVALAGPASAQTSDIQELKSAVQQMQKTINDLNAKIAELEKTKTGAPPAAVSEKDKSLAQIMKEGEQPATPAGEKAPVPYRRTLKDEQEAAPRAGALIMDPKYQGYMHQKLGKR